LILFHFDIERCFAAATAKCVKTRFISNLRARVQYCRPGPSHKYLQSSVLRIHCL